MPLTSQLIRWIWRDTDAFIPSDKHHSSTLFTLFPFLQKSSIFAPGHFRHHLSPYHYHFTTLYPASSRSPNSANLTRYRRFYSFRPTPFFYTIYALCIPAKKVNLYSRSFLPPLYHFTTLPLPPYQLASDQPISQLIWWIWRDTDASIPSDQNHSSTLFMLFASLQKSSIFTPGHFCHHLSPYYPTNTLPACPLPLTSQLIWWIWRDTDTLIPSDKHHSSTLVTLFPFLQKSSVFAPGHFSHHLTLPYHPTTTPPYQPTSQLIWWIWRDLDAFIPSDQHHSFPLFMLFQFLQKSLLFAQSHFCDPSLPTLPCLLPSS